MTIPVVAESTAPLAVRVYLGTATEEESAVVVSTAALRWPKATLTPRKAAFWMLTEHAAGNSTSRYRTLDQWVKEGKHYDRGRT